VIFSATTPKQNRNIPLLLACGHSMCEKCVKNIIQFIEPIECKVCKRDMEINSTDRMMLSENKITLYHLFPVNIFMLGEITLQYMEVSFENIGMQNRNQYNYLPQNVI
jgi:hypothetical protein